MSKEKAAKGRERGREREGERKGGGDKRERFQQTESTLDFGYMHLKLITSLSHHIQLSTCEKRVMAEKDIYLISISAQEVYHSS
jgi:hypothetical protein